MVRFDAPEGATPLEDVSGLLVDGVYTCAALNAVEAENILRAVNLHFGSKRRTAGPWLTDELIRRVHRDMFDRVWEWAGKYRSSELNIGVAAHKVREEIGKLCQDVAFWDAQTDGALPLLERGARLHHRLAWIHPFPNGNGRHARMMADIYFHVKGLPLPTWPSAAIGASGRERKEYLQALKSADAGDFGPLVEYTRKYLPREGKPSA